MFTGDRQKQKISPATSGGLNVVGTEQLHDQPLSPEELTALEPYEDMIMGNEQVDGIQGTNLFTIKYRHTDPEMAQKIANTLADVFASNNLERSTANSTRADDLLVREIAELQAKIRHDTEVMFNYQRAHNLPPTVNSVLDVEAARLSDLTKQLLEAEHQRKTAEAVYNSAQASTDKFSLPKRRSREELWPFAIAYLS
jgi:uncharacterized protein involved in exopolysaccharide biosynthesis